MSVRLSLAGLGRKKLTFGADDKHKDVTAIIMKAYTKLESCGGFLLLKAQGGGANRSLIELGCTYYDVSAIRRKSSGKGIIYIRPLQKDLDLHTQEVPSQV